MLTDIVGSTYLLRDLGEEAYRRALELELEVAELHYAETEEKG